MVFVLVGNVVNGENKNANKQLIVLAPPIKSNEYYSDKFEKVIPFYINYVDNVTAGTDDVVLIADKETMPYYKGKIDDDKLILAHIDDPWIRDVSPPIPSIKVQFTYIGGGGKSEAKFTQDIYDNFIKRQDITPLKSKLYLDGGNLVNNNDDKVITSRKFLTDNQLNETEGVETLKELLQVDYVSILTPDEEKLAHSDGMAAYVCNNTIYMHKQPEPNNTLARTELLKGCPHCSIIEIDGFFDDTIYKGGYSSSCGVYVNCVVTENYIYMPIFMHEKDAAALYAFRNNPCGKTVVPIDVRPVCEMGGSLRCLSWQTSGDYAEKLLKAAKATSSADRTTAMLIFSTVLVAVSIFIPFAPIF